MVIDEALLDEVTAQAKSSPRLRMNNNFHQRLDELCHRFLNAVEPGTQVPIHRHPTKDETFVLLRGRVVVKTPPSRMGSICFTVSRLRRGGFECGKVTADGEYL